MAKKKRNSSVQRTKQVAGAKRGGARKSRSKVKRGSDGR